MISAEEAFTAWKNGEQVYWVYNNEKTLIDADTTLDVFLTSHSFELKPRTITINGVELPAPFEPKEFEDCYMLTDLYKHGYAMTSWKYCKQVPAWRTEEEIKQVVAALRSVFK